MEKNRLEAFSDGVLAVIITIMVLELKVPVGDQWKTLQPVLPTLLCYLLSFIYIGIYWNNHHHLFQAVESINGAVLWANLHLLFWLSLVPFLTGWMGVNHFAPIPVALYGIVLMLAGVAYWILTRVLIAHHGKDSKIAAAIGRDFKGNVSIVVYAAGIALCLVSRWLSLGTYVLIALLWLIPDRRIERKMD